MPSRFDEVYQRLQPVTEQFIVGYCMKDGVCLNRKFRLILGFFSPRRPTVLQPKFSMCHRSEGIQKNYNWLNVFIHLFVCGLPPVPPLPFISVFVSARWWSYESSGSKLCHFKGLSAVTGLFAFIIHSFSFFPSKCFPSYYTADNKLCVCISPCVRVWVCPRTRLSPRLHVPFHEVWIKYCQLVCIRRETGNIVRSWS